MYLYWFCAVNALVRYCSSWMSYLYNHVTKYTALFFVCANCFCNFGICGLALSYIEAFRVFLASTSVAILRVIKLGTAWIYNTYTILETFGLCSLSWLMNKLDNIPNLKFLYQHHFWHSNICFHQLLTDCLLPHCWKHVTTLLSNFMNCRFLHFHNVDPLSSHLYMANLFVYGEAGKTVESWLSCMECSCKTFSNRIC